MKQVRGIIPLEQRDWCIVHLRIYGARVKSCNGALVAIDILQARFSEQAITDFWSKISRRYPKYSKVVNAPSAQQHKHMPARQAMHPVEAPPPPFSGCC